MDGVVTSIEGTETLDLTGKDITIKLNKGTGDEVTITGFKVKRTQTVAEATKDKNNKSITSVKKILEDLDSNKKIITLSTVLNDEISEEIIKTIKAKIEALIKPANMDGVIVLVEGTGNLNLAGKTIIIKLNKATGDEVSITGFKVKRTQTVVEVKIANDKSIANVRKILENLDSNKKRISILLVVKAESRIEWKN